MQITEWRQFIKNGLSLNEKKTSMTVGVFDGVHRGHQALIERVVSFNEKYAPVVVTFKQNHKTKNKEQRTESNELCDILTFRQRLDLFEKLGIQITVAVDFSDEFKKTPGIEFLKILLQRGNVGFFAAGSDFRCGYQLDTDSAAIESFFSSHNIPVEIVPQVMEGALPVSSSRIRAAIASGDLALADAMLGEF